VSYVVAHDSPSRPDEVVAFDRSADKRRKVYESAYPSGKIDWAELHGDHLVFADEDRIPSVGDEGTRWRLIALNLITGETQLLARSPGQRRSWPAVPQANDGGFAWAELERAADPRAGFRVRIWKPGWPEPRDILRRVSGIASASPHFYRGGVIYSAITSENVNGLYGIDVFAADASGARQQLTHDGLVIEFDLQDGLLAWAARPSEAQAAPGTADPFSVNFQEVGAQQNVGTVAAGFNAGNVTAGRDFIAWLSAGGRAKVTSVHGGAPAVLPYGRVWIPGRLDADGSTLTFATDEQQGIVVHIVEINPP